jgi:phospholipid/cholesterol/gamma-HCH transport system substrate-binding protein
MSVRKNAFETLVGVLVVAVAAGFLFFAYTSRESDNINGYDLKAGFNSADGINTGTDIFLHGVRIGTVSSMGLDPKTFLPVVHLSIREKVRLPSDSSVKITTPGLLGGSYLAIQPGSSGKMLTAGASIRTIQGSAGLSGLIDHITSSNSGSK